MESVHLLVGLGNPGAKYEDTRHNVGFLVAEAVAGRLRNRKTGKAFYSRWVEGAFAGRSLAVMLPMTYMNRSGEAVAAALRSGDWTAAEALVVYDCLDLPFGRIRMRQKGGSGGHRGLQSILDQVEREDVPRLRVGIGRPGEDGSVDHVLGRWSAEERAALPELVDQAADAVLTAVRAGVVAAMNRYNSWSLTTADAETGAETNETESEH